MLSAAEQRRYDLWQASLTGLEILHDRAIYLVGCTSDGRKVFAANPSRPWTDFVRVGEYEDPVTPCWHPGMYMRWREFKAEHQITITRKS